MSDVNDLSSCTKGYNVYISSMAEKARKTGGAVSEFIEGKLNSYKKKNTPKGGRLLIEVKTIEKSSFGLDFWPPNNCIIGFQLFMQ